MENKSDTPEKESNWVRIIVYSGLGVCALWAISLIVAWVVSSSWTERGAIGDTFGAINALFSGLAFAGVIVALFMQRAELELQRKELEETREVLKQTAATQEKAARISAAATVLAEVERQRVAQSDREAYAKWLSRKTALLLLIKLAVPEIEQALAFGDIKADELLQKLHSKPKPPS